jgi:hypothetical protein
MSGGRHEDVVSSARHNGSGDADHVLSRLRAGISEALRKKKAAIMNIDLARQRLQEALDYLKPNVVVQPGDTLQTILNLARPGDTIELAAGRHVCGELHLPNNITLTGQVLPGAQSHAG